MGKYRKSFPTSSERDQGSAHRNDDLCHSGRGSADLKTCKVYISVFGDDEAKKETIRGLKSAEGFIRRMLAKTINLRNTPELTFVLDESIEYGVTMSKLIDEVTHKEDKRMRKMKKIDEILNGVSPACHRRTRSSGR